MVQILDTTDTTSKVFRCHGGTGVVHCPVHNGGDWQLQIQSPDDADVWTGLTDVTISSPDALYFRTPQGARMRFNGGDMGAKIFVQGVTVDE